ncbi:MAG: phosphatase PAP2 family protein [Treponema sp.]|nr:phosphatase PAP2 family protein [Treponema sp.]
MLFAENQTSSETKFNIWGSREVFALNPLTDGILFGSGILLSGGNLITKYAIELNRQEYKVQSFDKEDVNAFDRIFMNSYSKTKDRVADVFMLASMASPLVLAATDKEEWLTCALMYSETLMIANGVKEMVKVCVDRTRPYMYYDSDTYPSDVSEDGDWADSFFSGHATMSFAGATFASYTFCKYFPESSWRIPVVAGSYALALTAASLRILSGNHFMTDVITGAVFGSGVGFLVPWLHTFNAKHEDLNLSFWGNGFSLAVKL